MKLALDIKAQNELFAAFHQLDGQDVVTPGVENGARLVRVPYKLGAVRRSVVKNLNALSASLQSYGEIRTALIRETWPNLQDGEQITRDQDPGNFDRCQDALKEIDAKTDELELLPLPAAAMYGDNEFPNAALAVLERHGLIAEAT